MPAAADQKRKWLFRLASLVLSPLLVLGLLEGGLRLAGYGYPTCFFMRRNVGSQNLITENEKYGYRFFGSALARKPRQFALPAVKSPETCRIFVLGESAAYGDPQPEFGLPRMLEVLMRERWPGTKFQVVNAAMTGINSHVVRQIAQDCTDENGDLWVIYMGNNEVVGPFGSGTVFGPQVPPIALIRASMASKRMRTGQLLADLGQRWHGQTPDSSYWGGLKMFLQHQVAQDDPRMTRVYDHFARNLADILALGRNHRVKVVVSTVLANLKDCAPFASAHRQGLTDTQLAEWTRLYEIGVKAEEAGRFAEAIGAFADAGRIDDKFADLQFRWGRCCLALGKDEEAHRHFRAARDADALRFRVDSRLNDLIRQTARSRERELIFLVDAEQSLARQSPHGIPGDELLYEHVHLNFQGNYLLARTLAEQIDQLLPENVKLRAKTPRQWLSASGCAQKLAWTDWNRYEAAESMLQRFSDAPFTHQLDNAEKRSRVQKQMEQLRPALSAIALHETVSAYQRALADAPDDWVLHYNLARLQQKLGDFAGAAESCRQVVRLLPHCSEVHAQLGVLLARQGQFDEAIRRFDIALRIDPGSVAAINGRGLAMARTGLYDAAIREYQRALKLDPASGETHLNLGMALSAQGKHEEAKRHFRKALERRILKADAMVTLGKMCFSLGWISEAITNFTDALRLEPTHAPAHFYLGGVLASAGRRAEAQAHYAEAVRLDPELAEAHLGLGIELGRQGHDLKAIEHFAEAVRLMPNLIEARLNLGIALNKQQRFNEAVQQFQEALRLDPTNAIARKYLEAIQSRRPQQQQVGTRD